MIVSFIGVLLDVACSRSVLGHTTAGSPYFIGSLEHLRSNVSKHVFYVMYSLRLDFSSVASVFCCEWFVCGHEWALVALYEYTRFIGFRHSSFKILLKVDIWKLNYNIKCCNVISIIILFKSKILLRCIVT